MPHPLKQSSASSGAFLASAGLAYACLYPVWRWASPLYDGALGVCYSLLAPFIEFPRLTDALLAVRSTDRPLTWRVLSNAVRGGGFEFDVQNLHFNTAILVALAVASSRIPWSRRARMTLQGLAWVTVWNALSLAVIVRTSYARVPFVAVDSRPGLLVLGVAEHLRSVLYSDLAILFPVLVWVALAWSAPRHETRVGDCSTTVGSRLSQAHHHLTPRG
jgi:hypothetical protein